MVVLAVILLCCGGVFLYLTIQNNQEVAFDEKIAVNYLTRLQEHTAPEASEEPPSAEQTAVNPSSTETSAEEYEPWRVDMEGLRAINPDCIGWIWVPYTSINYPVVQCSNNSYYLNHRFDESYSKEGAIFMDAKCSLTDNNFILYGHNTTSGKFEPLVDYLRYGQEFYQNHPCFVFYSEEYPEGVIYDIYSVFRANISTKASANSIYMIASDLDYMDYMSSLSSKSIVDTDVELSEDRQTIILSTCSYGANRRCVVCGIARADVSAITTE